MMDYKEVLTSDIEFSDNRKIISLKDKKSKGKYIAQNPGNRHVCVYRVDDGLIKNNEPKCDWLMVAKQYKYNPDFYFVELKGRHIEHAIKQLNNSILFIMPDINYSSVHCRLVSSKEPAPNINSTNRIKLGQKLKKMNGTLKIQSRQIEETI